MRRKIYFEIYSHALRSSLRVAFSLRFIWSAASSWLRLGAARFTSYAMIAAAIYCIAQFVLVRPISGLVETPLRVLATSEKRQNCLGTAVMQIASPDSSAASLT